MNKKLFKKTNLKNGTISLTEKESCSGINQTISINIQIDKQMKKLAKCMTEKEFWKLLDGYKPKNSVNDVDYKKHLLKWINTNIKKQEKKIKMAESIFKMKQIINLVGENEFWAMLNNWKEIQKEQNPKLKKLDDDKVIMWLDQKIEFYKNKKN